VVRGIGWQRAGAIANLGAYYAVGLPVACISLFVFHVDSKVRLRNSTFRLQLRKLLEDAVDCDLCFFVIHSRAYGWVWVAAW
jgi:Na+-driven multidrug efflux pump